MPPNPFQPARALPRRRQSSRARVAEIEPRGGGAPGAEEHLFSGSAREVEALRRIAATMGTEPHAVLHGLLAAAVDLCGGGADTSTAGVSLLEPGPDGTEQFRWVALAGCLSDHTGESTPRNFSCCGECLDRGKAIIFSRPDLKYGHLSRGGIECTQGLVVPFRASATSVTAGTIWVISHPPRRHHFDEEDGRLMQTIADFAAASYWMAKAFDDANRSRQVLQQTVTDLSREMRTPLNVIAASAFLLTLDGPDLPPAERAAHLERIERAVKLLLGNVETLKGTDPPETITAGMNAHDTAALEVKRAIAEAELCERLLRDVERAAEQTPV